MIDWFTGVVPFVAPIIDGGVYTSTNELGEIEYQVRKWKKCLGSFDSSIQVRTEDRYHLRISGNPVKLLQGHNIWGSSDLIGLVLETTQKISNILGVEQPQPVYDAIKNGDFTLSRIDINKMYQFESAQQAEQYRYHLQTNARTRTGTAVTKSDTVYFNKTSKRWTIKAYNKHEEINSRRNRKHQDFNRLTPSVVDWTLDKMRVELTLKSNELRDKKLHKGANWAQIDIYELFDEYMGRIDMTSQKPSDSILVELSTKPTLLATYTLWKDGQSLKKIYNNNKFYSHRRALLSHGIDISIPPTNKPSTAKIVPLNNIIRPAEAVIPDWAYGTDLLFEPRHMINVS